MCEDFDETRFSSGFIKIPTTVRGFCVETRRKSVFCFRIHQTVHFGIILAGKPFPQIFKPQALIKL